MRFPIEIVKRIRKEVGDQFIIIFRLSMIDLVEDGSDWKEIVELAKKIEEAGATIINTGIGWHEARVPTIATRVPRAAFTEVTQRMKKELKIPLIATNRINTPEVAESILAEGHSDMISMARPFLADPDFVNKAKMGREDEINTCIGCNQACLDHVFVGKRASCLVNPRACYESEMIWTPATKRLRIAVVGAGPAGLSFAAQASHRGHEITLFEAGPEIGGQFNLAKKIPGKEEFQETIRYFRKKIEQQGVILKLNQTATIEELKNGKFDHIVLATGITPRIPRIAGIDHPKVLSYPNVIQGKVTPGRSVAIIGAGGIGFDVAGFLTESDHSLSLDPVAFRNYWGIDITVEALGGLIKPQPSESDHVAQKGPSREVYLLQRSEGKLGASLSKTTGWIHRASLKNQSVKMWDAVTYRRIDDEGLHIERKGKKQTLKVDHVILCAGQDPLKNLYTPLIEAGITTHLIGGADVAKELDAKRAISQGVALANSI